jgi:hypothetical protein
MSGSFGRVLISGVPVAVSGFLSGYLIVVSGDDAATVAGATAALVAFGAICFAAGDSPPMQTVQIGLGLGLFCGMSFALGGSTPHIAEVGGRVREQWTEMGWVGAVLFLVTVWGVLGALSGAAIGFAFAGARGLWRAYTRHTLNQT